VQGQTTAAAYNRRGQMATALLRQVYGSHMFRETQNTKARQKKRTMEGLDYA